MHNEFVRQFMEPVKTGNAFKDLNPLSKLNILLVLALSSLVAKNIIYSAALCVLFYIMAAMIGEWKYFTGIFNKLVITIGLFMIILREISVKGTTVLFSIFGWKWTLEGLLNGLSVGLSILSFSGAIIMFYASTQMRDLMYALEQKGVSHTTSYIMLSSFQTITDLKESVNTIFESQKARGIEVEGNFIRRMKAFIPILSPLIMGAMSSAEEKSIAMDARAFSVERKHTFLRELRPVPGSEKALVIAVDLAFAAFCVLRILGAFVLK